eukprot:2549460-Rhodomonas_salina.2
MVLRCCAILSWGMVLCAVWYRARVWCYAVCGTERGYGATRRRGGAAMCSHLSPADALGS